MLIGFVIIIVMILVIVGLMAIGTSGGDDTGIYSAQIKKVKVLINNIESEAIMYHGLKDTYKGFNAEYLSKNGIGTELYTNNSSDVSVTMNKANWDNLPTDFDCDGTEEDTTVDFLSADYGGVFLFKGYEPGNQKAIIVYSCTDITGDNYAQIKFVQQKTKTYNTKFDEMLELELTEQDTFYGS